MSLFTLDWFKANQKKKLSKLIIEEQKLKNDLLKAQLETTEKKLYSKLKMVNDVLTIVFENGEIMSKIPATVEDFVRVKDAVSREGILSVFNESSNQKDDELRKHKSMINIAKGINVLDKIDDFEVINGAVYLKGIKRSLPELLVNKFMEIVSEFIDDEVVKNELFTDERYLSLKRFFMWCCLNPRAEVADSLYEFLVKNSFKITRQGFFVALRNVVTLHGSNELVQFVSNAYTKIKAVWKKKPDDYFIILQPDGSYKMMYVEDMFKTTEETCEYCDGSGEVYYEDCEDEENGCNDMCDYCDGTGKVKVTRHNYEGEQLGTLTDLYLDLPNRHENRFTDDWTKTFDIRIGRVVSMPMEEANWSTQDCAAAGLVV